MPQAFICGSPLTTLDANKIKYAMHMTLITIPQSSNLMDMRCQPSKKMKQIQSKSLHHPFVVASYRPSPWPPAVATLKWRIRGALSCGAGQLPSACAVQTLGQALTAGLKDSGRASAELQM